MFSDAKRGKLTRYMLEEQYSIPSETRLIYERFSGGTEEKKVLLLSLNRDITESLNLNVSYTFVDWENAGFNPSDPQADADLPNIQKHSMGIAVRYGF